MFKVDALLEQLTIEEKVSFCSGLGPWSIKKVERLGIELVLMSDVCAPFEPVLDPTPHGAEVSCPADIMTPIPNSKS